MMNLVDMKLSRDEADAMKPQQAASDQPAYPYGLRLSLDKSSLEKLGIGSEEDYEVGTECAIKARGSIVGYSMSKNQDGSESRCVEIQITALAIQPQEDGDEGETKLGRAAYGKPAKYKG